MMEQANRILTVLEEAGHEAYIIGGAVKIFKRQTS